MKVLVHSRVNNIGKRVEHKFIDRSCIPPDHLIGNVIGLITVYVSSSKHLCMV